MSRPRPRGARYEPDATAFHVPAPQIPRADEGRLRAAAPSGEWLPASASTRRLTRGPGPARCYHRHASGTTWDSRSTGITSPAARRSLITLSCCGRRTDCSRGDQGRDSPTSHRRGAAAALRWYFSHGRRPLAPRESRASDAQRRPRPRLSTCVEGRDSSASDQARTGRAGGESRPGGS